MVFSLKPQDKTQQAGTPENQKVTVQPSPASGGPEENQRNRLPLKERGTADSAPPSLKKESVTHQTEPGTALPEHPSESCRHHRP